MISSCPTISVGFDCSHDPDPLNQDVRHFLFLSQTTDLAGSEWNRSLASPITFNQSDYFVEALSSMISFFDDAVGVRDLSESVVDPIVLANGLSVSGGRVSGSPDAPISAIFDSTTLKGMVLYVPSDGHVDLARADAASTTRAVGLANEDVTASATGDYITEGQIEKSDWTTVAGTTFLTPGVFYYLSTTNAGQITSTAPSTATEYVVVVGRALTNTVLDVEIAQPILL